LRTARPARDRTGDRTSAKARLLRSFRISIKQHQQLVARCAAEIAQEIEFVVFDVRTHVCNGLVGRKVEIDDCPQRGLRFPTVSIDETTRILLMSA
jgi:hypothetical protein